MEAIIRTREVLDYADSLRRGNQDAVAALLESATSPTNTVEGIRCLPVCTAVPFLLMHPPDPSVQHPGCDLLLSRTFRALEHCWHTGFASGLMGGVVRVAVRLTQLRTMAGGVRVPRATEGYHWRRSLRR